MNLKLISKLEDEFIYLFNDNLEEINNGAPDFIRKIRQKAIADFEKLGIPDKNNDDYRYTDFRKIFNNNYKKLFKQEKYEVDINEVFQCNVPDLDTHLVLLINGTYYENNKPLENFPKNVIICGFAEACKKYPDIVKKYYTHNTKTKNNGIVALNTAFAQDGLFMYIPENVILEKAIQIVNILYTTEDRMIQQRNLIIAKENSQAKIIICDHTLSEQKYLTNNVTEIFVEKNAVFDYYNMQDEHNFAQKVNSIYLLQKEKSNALTNIISLHGGNIINNVNVLMNGEHCENQTYGIYLADKEQHIDNYSFIDHAKPNCTSNELYKGMLDDKATGVFSGKILVRQDAQNTKAFQANNNILVSDDAKMNTKPQLEIYADDVKCSHGATVGQLDEEAMFYMRARGISKKEAKMLLMFAFAAEVINKIRILPLQERIKDLVEKRLRGELTRCANCTINCYQTD